MGRCSNPNPGSPVNAPCCEPKGHQGNHSNGYSEWTNKTATSGNKSR